MLLGFTAGLTLCLFFQVFFRGETFSDRDLTAYYRPAKSIIASLTRASGEIPLWNPFFNSGQPFAANPEHEIYFPLTTLFLFLPFELAFRLQVLIPIALAPIGMFVFLRALGRTTAAALLGAMAWGAGGYLLSVHWLLPILFAVCVAPFTLTMELMVLREGRLRHVAALAATFAIQCLAGEPSTLLSMSALALAVAVHVAHRATRGGRMLAALGLVLGIGIGAAALVPGLHHASKTDRVGGLGQREAAEWSMPPARLLDLVTPHALGNVVKDRPDLYWGRSLYLPRGGPYLPSLYPGLLVSLLGVGAFFLRGRALAAWGGAAAVGLLLSLGQYLPGWSVFRRIPGLASLRFPEKFALLLVFALVVASAHGCDLILQGGASRRRRWATAAAIVFLLAVVVAATLPALAAMFPAPFPTDLARQDALRLALVAAATVAVLVVGRCSRRRRALLATLLVVTDLVLVGRDMVHTVPVTRATRPPAFLLPVINQSRDVTIFHGLEWEPEKGKVGGVAAPPIPAQWGLATTFERDFDRTMLRWTNIATSEFWRTIRRSPGLTRPLLLRRGVSAIVSSRPGSRWDGDTLVGPDGQAPVMLLSLEGAQPFVFAASRIERFDGDAGWSGAVMRSGAEIPTTACVERREAGELHERPAPADVRVIRRSPIRAELAVEARGPGISFLAVNQTWDEGWTATVDGASVRVLRTDLSLQGLVVPPGRHAVVLAYGDVWVHVGQIASTLCCLVCLCLVCVPAFRRRRTSRPGAALS